MNKLRKDVEEANIQQESILSNLKRKQGDATAEMTEQVLHSWTKDFYFYFKTPFDEVWLRDWDGDTLSSQIW